MDRDVLSDATVVAASRDFVCARVLTYESAEEAPFLASLFRTRSGELENTVFAILAPDGKTPLTGTGRSPEMAFGLFGPRAAGTLAAEMKKIARQHPEKASASRDPPTMPYLVDVRRGLDAAACDMLPLAVVVAKDPAARSRLEAALRPVVWKEPLLGRVLYAPASSTAALEKIRGVPTGATLVVLQPDAFGLTGTVLAATTKADAKSLESTLRDALARQDPGTKDAGEQIREGHRQGVHWETEIPVTDPGPSRGRGSGH